MENKRNYYRILHVQPDAPVELIAASYRTMMQKMKMHPDLGGDESDASIINEAYAVLSDPKKRSEYDKLLFGTTSKANVARQNATHRAGSKASSRQARATQAKPASVKKKASLKTKPALAVVTTSSITECAFCREPYNGTPAYDANCTRCKSPLLAITPQQYEQDGQRKIERIPDQSQFEFCDQWPGKWHQGNLKNLSLNGLQFQSNITLALGVRIRIESAKFSGVAQISNQKPLGNGLFVYGGKFLTLRFLHQSGSFVHTQV